MAPPMLSDRDGLHDRQEEPAALTVAAGADRAPGAPTWRGISVAEAIEDYRLCCLAQAVDEREATFHKQGAAYFHV